MLHCDRCGYEKAGNSWNAGQICQVCRIGTMRAGLAASGFRVDHGTVVPRQLVAPAYQATTVGQVQDWQAFNYFAGESGDAYRTFLLANTRYVGAFTNILVPDPGRFAWLTPYTGNKHNRTHFTQMLLALVARAKFTANGGRFPRLIEPFLGSGQVFLHAGAWGPSFNQGLPLFHEVIGGDLNPYVIAAYRFVQAFGTAAAPDYLLSAKNMDESQVDQYPVALRELNLNGRARVADTDNPGEGHEAGVLYIWLVNRCLRTSSLNPQGGINARRNTDLDLARVRQREGATIEAVRAGMGQVRMSYAERDFAQTCALAGASDIVFMDCPFPKFSNRVPDPTPQRPETFGSATANTYGTGDDGAALQTRIVQEAARLTAQGTTVILCNFANPGLVLAYRGLMTGIAPDQQRDFVYTYRSPSTQSEAYQITILPGSNVDFSGLPQQIWNNWASVGGDNIETQEYLDQSAMEVDSDDGSDDSGEDPDYVEGSGDEDYDSDW